MDLNGCQVDLMNADVYGSGAKTMLVKLTFLRMCNYVTHFLIMKNFQVR